MYLRRANLMIMTQISVNSFLRQLTNWRRFWCRCWRRSAERRWVDEALRAGGACSQAPLLLVVPDRLRWTLVVGLGDADARHIIVAAATPLKVAVICRAALDDARRAGTDTDRFWNWNGQTSPLV